MDIDTIVSPFQLVGTKVVKFRMTNDYVTLANNPHIKCDASYSVDNVEKQDNIYMGIMKLNIKAVTKGPAKAKMSCNITIEGCFACPEEIGEDSFIKMLGINGCASLFSIARAFICSTTALATSGGHLILPMINTFKLVDAETESGKNNSL